MTTSATVAPVYPTWLTETTRQTDREIYYRRPRIERGRNGRNRNMDIYDFKFLGQNFASGKGVLLEFINDHLMHIQKDLYDKFKDMVDEFYYEQTTLLCPWYDMALEFYFEEKDVKDLWGNTELNDDGSDKKLKDLIPPQDPSKPPYSPEELHTLREQIGLKHWCGIRQAHRGWREGTRSYHKSGTGFDFNYDTNPWFCTRRINGANITYGGEGYKTGPRGSRVNVPLGEKTTIYERACNATDRACNFLYGENADLSTPNQYHWNNSPEKSELLNNDNDPDNDMTPDQILDYNVEIISEFDRFEKCNQALRKYFLLGVSTTGNGSLLGADTFRDNFLAAWASSVFNIQTLDLLDTHSSESRETIDDLFKAPGQNVDAGNSQVQSILNDYYNNRFSIDFRHIQPVLVIGSLARNSSGNLYAPNHRNPTKGLMDIPKHVVLSFVQEGKLSWGGTMWGRNSGDIMHFDNHTRIQWAG